MVAKSRGLSQFPSIQILEEEQTGQFTDFVISNTSSQSKHNLENFLFIVYLGHFINERWKINGD